LKTINVTTINGIVQETVYTVYDFPYFELQFLPTCRKGNRATYYNVASAFDIEATTQYRKEMVKYEEKVVYQRAFMYHWQFCIDDKVVFGRTWEEFTILLSNLRK